MTALAAKALHRAFEIHLSTETLKSVVVFCGGGLAVSLVLASYGLDLSSGFF